MVSRISVSTDLLDFKRNYSFDCEGKLTSEIHYHNGKVSLEETIERNDSLKVATRVIYKDGLSEIETIIKKLYFRNSFLKQEQIQFFNDTIKSFLYFDFYQNPILTISYKNDIPNSLKLFSNSYGNELGPMLEQVNPYEEEISMHRKVALVHESCKVDSATMLRSFYSGDTLYTVTKDDRTTSENFEIINNEREHKQSTLLFGEMKLIEVDYIYPDSIINIATTFNLDTTDNWKEIDIITYIETDSFTKHFRNKNEYECCLGNNSFFKYTFDDKGNWTKREKYDIDGELQYSTYREIEYCK